MFHRRILNCLSLLAYRITDIEQTVNNPQPVTRNRRPKKYKRGKIRNPVTAFQRWLIRNYGREAK